MRSFISAAALTLAASSLVSAAPTIKPEDVRHLSDGFPVPNPAQFQKIEAIAHGQVSNLPPPKKLSDDTRTSLRLIAFNENFEVHYFKTVLRELDNPHFIRNIGQLRVGRDTLKEVFRRIVAVEEVHSVNANNALDKVFHSDRILPCKYKFPVDNIVDAIKLADTFTPVVIGTLEDVVFQAASNGDAGFTPGVVAAVGDEAQQDGGFRSYLGLAPQSNPFSTRAFRDLAWSILQDFVEAGSCPNAHEIDLTVFQPLSAENPPAHDTDIKFKFSLKDTRVDPAKHPKSSKIQSFSKNYGHGGDAWKGLSITYFTGQSIVTEHIKSFHIKGDEVTVTAFFPQSKYEIFGLAIAVLTVGDNFQSVAEVEAATMYGPAPLIVQEGRI